MAVLPPLALAMMEPLISNVPRASDRPAFIVSLDLSLEKRPVDSAAKANTDDTTTKAISTMAVSSPVMPPRLPPGFRYGSHKVRCAVCHCIYPPASHRFIDW